jgi:BirA family transcriptional regulator, biotin operon repressor / biotin---[acetyl-CoA-carboxylase] ligase
MDRKLDELLYALIQNTMITVSGEKLARDLGVSHSTLVRWVDKLRHAGIDIRGELFTGYRLVRLPDVLLPQLIRPRLHTRLIGRNLYHFYDVDSTNLFAARLLAHGRKLPEGTIIIAESQTAGRGRLGRTWHSERESGIYFSMILFPKAPPSLAPLFTLATAVAMHNAVERYTGLDIDIKWPNDLLVGRQKFCGILSEIQAEVDLVKTMIVGVGVNANHEHFPEDIAHRATSLRIASGRIQSRIEILLEFFEEFENIYMDFERKGTVGIIDQWTRFSSFANGRKIEIHDGVRKIAGVTRGLNPLGALRIEQKRGEVEEVYSGDVVAWE